MDIYNFVSLSGIFFLMGLAWLGSHNKKNINYRLIVFGLSLQAVTALFLFKTSFGSRLFLLINDLVIRILDSANAGSQFVFGRLALGPGETNAAGDTSLGFVLAFQALPTIIFFSALISILYYFRVMPLLIKGLAYIFTRLMQISGAESLAAASNIFVGIESALTVKPHLDEMTPSELCTILSVGMATVASNVLALYVIFLKEAFPSIAGHLISASLLSAPAALIMSKLILPEDGQPRTLGQHITPHYHRDKNVFEAIINGANAGVKMIVGIIALLIAVLGLVSLCDMFLGFITSKLNAIGGFALDLSLKGIAGYIFYPLTIMIGIPIEDAGVVSQIIGERLIVTEVVAYQDLAKALNQNLIRSSRSIVIATYALCGFSHVASMAIFVGGISALAPKQTQTLSKVAFRALIASTLACLMTAAIAGTFFNDQLYILNL
jgi:CNT family concentrative nucleoside transporter